MSTCSHMAENLIGSEIIKLAAIVQQKIQSGQKIFNFTIGDFDPIIYPIPSDLKREIQSAYEQNQTNYPPAAGLHSLLDQVVKFFKNELQLEYLQDECLISGGARPLIYALYQTILDPGDKVIYPVPSWNNNHYCHLARAQGIEVETKPENNFMPTVDLIKPFLSEASLVALCSPLNPTGTCFNHQDLSEICLAILKENESRELHNKKPVYLLYDQIYHMLTFADTKHVDPVNLIPEMRPYTIYIDGLSKAFASTGIRVGWALGPKYIIGKMRAILSHVGAWSPKPEQYASARYLSNRENYQNFVLYFKDRLEEVIQTLYAGLRELQDLGMPVRVIKPQAGLYLTVSFDLLGKQTRQGSIIQNQGDSWQFLLEEAKIALVPFSAFGANIDSSWYRLSIGTCSPDMAREALKNLKMALQTLS